MMSKITAFLAKITGRRNKSADLALPQAEESLKQAASLKSPAPRPGFQAELLAKLQSEKRQPASMSSKMQYIVSFIKIRPVQFTATIATVVLVAIVATTLHPLIPQESTWSRLIVDEAFAQDNFEVVPTKADSLGVAKDTSFTIKSKSAISLADLEKSLVLVPKVKVNIKAISDREFSVTPAEALQDRTIYKVIINSGFVNATGATLERDYSWAFQVKDQFKVLGTIPRDTATYVPLNTGIEIMLSKAGFKDAPNYFSIEPKIEGRFETHNRTLVFIPKKNLEPATVYTVTLKKGLPLEGSAETLPADTRFRFETQSVERTNANTYFDFSYTSVQSEFTTDIAPALSIYKSRDSVGSMTVEVYQVASAEAYAKIITEKNPVKWSSYSKKIDLQGLKKINTFKSEVVMNDYQGYVIFPKALPAGHYVVNATLEGVAESRQALLQVSNLMNYVSENVDKTLVWVNHRITKKSVPHATVSLRGQKIGETGDDGVLTFETKRWLQNDFDQYAFVPAVLTVGKESLVFNLLSQGSKQLSDETKYWSYMYSDRPLYRSDDTINIWGFVKGEDGSIPTDVKVRITADSYDYYNEPIVVAESRVTINPNGSFNTQLKLKGALPRWYYVSLIKGDDDYLTNTSLTVSDYVKPAYTLKLEGDKENVFSGEAVTYTATAKFFDGTPVPKADVVFTFNYGTEIVATTDAFGVATVVYRHSNTTEYNPNYVTVRAQVKQGENALIDDALSVLVFNSHIYGSNTFVIDDNKMGTIVTSITSVDPNKSNDNKVDSFNEDYYFNEYQYWFRTTPAAGVRFIATVTESWYEVVETGEVYNFITKLKEKTYSSEYRTQPFATYTGVTDEKGQFTHTLPVDPTHQYHVRVVATDQFGLKDYSNGYGSSRYYYNYSNDYEYYSLKLRDESKRTYKVNEEFTFDVIGNKGPVSSTGQFMYLKLNDGLETYTISKEGKYTGSFATQDIPNVTYEAVWFDGTNYREINNPITLNYNHEDKVLKVEVRTDKKEYKPGAPVTATVTVTDIFGNPVKTAFNMNVVDEALFALSNQDVRTDEVLYRSLYKNNWQIYSFASHRAMHLLPPSSGAEGGGGGDGGGEFRTVFKDTGLFFSGETSDQGTATVAFTLPDNVTSWRLTTQAISKDLEAGNAINNIAATLPFFIEVTAPTEVLVADKPSIKLRAYGKDLQVGQAISATVQATDFGLNSTQNGTAFSGLYFSLPQLSLGSHTVTTSVAVGKTKDGIVQEMKVIESRVQEYANELIILAPTSTVKNVAGGTTITFSDAGRAKLLYDFYDLAFQPGDRVDQRLARQVGQKFLNAHFDRDYTIESWNGNVYQTNGGLSIVSYGGQDLDLTARLAYFANDYFNRPSYLGYLYGVVNNKTSSKDEIIYAWYGLAQMNEPVLLEVQSLAKDTSLTPMQSLVVASALESLGDREAARSVYSPLVKKYAESLGAATRLAFDKNADTTLIATAMAANLSVAMNDTIHEKLFAYVKTHSSREVTVLAEKAKYLEAALRALPKEAASFTLVIDGQETKIVLGDGRNVTYQLSKDQRDHMSFKDISGRVALMHTYRETADSTSATTSKDMSITRRYEVNDAATTVMKEGDMVTVVLSGNVAGKLLTNNTFEITDYLPSGLKPIDSYSYTTNYDKASYCRSYPSSVEGQKVTFQYNSRCSTVYYMARVITPGTYVAEPAVIQSVDSPEYKNFSTSGSITIK